MRKLLFPLLLLSPVALGQVKPPPPPVESGEVIERPDETNREAEDVKARHGKGEKEEIRRSGRSLVQFTVGVRPDLRIPPGGTARCEVVMALVGDAVLQSPSSVKFEFEQQQGALVLGDAVFQPAKPAKISKAFRGQSVYDNYAIFELPITIAAGTPMGTKLIGNLGLQYELLNGESGSAMGQFFDHVQIPVEVGIPRRATVIAPRETPVAPAAAEPKDPQPAAAAQPTRAANWVGDGEATQATGPEAGHAVRVDDQPKEPAPAHDKPMPPADPEGGVTWMAAGAGLVVVALLVLMLSMRKR